MEAGPHQLQMFVNMVVILAAALVALVCDFLRRNNQQLRELTIALRTQHPGMERRRAERPALAPPAEAAQRVAVRTAERVHRIQGRIQGQRPASPRPADSPQPSHTKFPEARKVSEGRRTAPVVSIRQAVDAAAAAPPAKDIPIPAGLHDPSTLEARLAQNGPVSGAVIAVTFQETGGDAGRRGTSVNSAVRECMASLIAEGGFACPRGQWEYLLLFPQETGAAAQRRIGQVAERLWDFQLRSMGALPVTFSWGAVEAEHEPLSDVIAAARERMRETQRNRKTGAEALRKTV